MIITTTKTEKICDICKKDENVKEHIKSKYKCQLCKKDICSYHTKMFSFSKPTLIKKECDYRHFYKKDEYAILCNYCYKIMMEKEHQPLPLLTLKD